MKGFLLGLAAGYMLAKAMEGGAVASLSGLGALPTAMTPVPCDPAYGCVCFDCRCPRPGGRGSYAPSPGIYAASGPSMKGW